MNTFPAEFFTIDLNIESKCDPAAIVTALEKRAVSIHTHTLGRQYCLRGSLVFQPKSPTDAIRSFAKLVRDRPARERSLWAKASCKEFDIGVQAGFERGSG